MDHLFMLVCPIIFDLCIANDTWPTFGRPNSWEKREWPRRKPHRPPNPPIILTLTAELKALIQNHSQITHKSTRHWQDASGTRRNCSKTYI
jgi:hypothetical protein